jgi:hypothetical protein
MKRQMMDLNYKTQQPRSLFSQPFGVRKHAELFLCRAESTSVEKHTGDRFGMEHQTGTVLFQFPQQINRRGSTR